MSNDLRVRVSLIICATSLHVSPNNSDMLEYPLTFHLYSLLIHKKIIPISQYNITEMVA